MGTCIFLIGDYFRAKGKKEYVMNAFFTPILSVFQDPFAANVACLCIGALYFAALIRSQLNKGEGAH
jgi:hypothetical protein